jgi:hypothetical protein
LNGRENVNAREPTPFMPTPFMPPSIHARFPGPASVIVCAGQDQKAESPMVVTLLGIVTLISLVQLTNAKFLIVLTPLGIE